MSEWQLIDTAPKDGSEVCLGVFLSWGEQSKERDNPLIGNGFYHTGAWFWKNGVWRNRLAQYLHKPTHWMPMPEPPET